MRDAEHVRDFLRRQAGDWQLPEIEVSPTVLNELVDQADYLPRETILASRPWTKVVTTDTVSLDCSTAFVRKFRQISG